MAEELEVGKCGPICQHPGCWQTSPHAGHPQHKDTEYMRFLSELFLRKKELKLLQEAKARDGMHSSTHTSDGLPTLKVHSMDQEIMEGKIRPFCRRRSKTLPPLKISTRKCTTDIINRHQMPSKSNVNYVQMQLQVDREALDSSLCPDMLFSPVLLWRPGRKQPARQTCGENSNRLRADKPDIKPSSSFPPHPHTPLLSPPARPRAINGSRKRREGGMDVRGDMTENVISKRNRLPFKTTNLTDALPRQEGLESTVNDNKDTVTSTKHGKSRQHRISTADVECFSYLGDIPSQLVAEILHQLRSESSSNIDETTANYQSITSALRHSVGQSQHRIDSSGSVHSHNPIESYSHSNHPQSTRLPGSLAYELSTKKVVRPNPVRPDRRVSSFSRELSRRPLEVLKKRSSHTYNSKQQLMDRIHVPKTVRNQARLEKCTEGHESGGPLQASKRQPCLMHLPTAEIDPPTDPPSGLQPHCQPPIAQECIQRDSPGNSPSHHRIIYTRPSHARFGRHQTVDIEDNNNATNLTDRDEDDIHVLRPRVPSTILMQLQEDSELKTQQALMASLEGRKSARGQIHVPRHHVSLTRNTAVCPFSEETSPNHELETRAMFLKRRERLYSREKTPRQLEHRQASLIVDEAQIRPSISPDYMLVGAHFSDNNLVLMDKDGRVIHQLTDTEAESDANIMAHLSEVNVNTTRLARGPEHKEIPQVESFDYSEDVSQTTADVSRLSTSTKAPPPTAMEVSMPSRTEEEEEEGRGLSSVAEVEGEEVQIGAVDGQETVDDPDAVTVYVPEINKSDEATDSNIVNGTSNVEVQETILSVADTQKANGSNSGGQDDLQPLVAEALPMEHMSTYTSEVDNENSRQPLEAHDSMPTADSIEEDENEEEKFETNTEQEKLVDSCTAVPDQTSNCVDEEGLALEVASIERKESENSQIEANVHQHKLDESLTEAAHSSLHKQDSVEDRQDIPEDTTASPIATDKVEVSSENKWETNKEQRSEEVIPQPTSVSRGGDLVESTHNESETILQDGTEQVGNRTSDNISQQSEVALSSNSQSESQMP